jgi:molybdenum cofactor biosynthesis enzyme MoaA
MYRIIGGKQSKKRNKGSDLTEGTIHQLDRKKERVRQHLILIANLSASIVEELRMSSNCMSKDDIVKRYTDYSVAQIEDALDSAIEDEYIEFMEQEDDTSCYRAIHYDDDA